MRKIFGDASGALTETLFSLSRTWLVFKDFLIDLMIKDAFEFTLMKKKTEVEIKDYK